MTQSRNSVDLEQIARRVRAREETIALLFKRTVDDANATLTEVIEQGQDLQLAKANCHNGAATNWPQWLSLNVTTVSSRRAAYYIASLRRSPQVQDWQEAHSLQALLPLPDVDNATPAPEPRRWPDYMEGIAKCARFISHVERYPIATWPVEGLEKLRRDLEPIAKELWPDKF